MCKDIAMKPSKRRFKQKTFYKRKTPGNYRKRQWWESKYTYDPEKRTKLLDREVIHGPEPLSVIWDDGRRFLREVSKITKRFPGIKDKEHKKVVWELFLEGEYEFYRRVTRRRYASKRYLAVMARHRRIWNRRKAKAIRLLKKTMYGYLPKSATLSTMPT